MALYNLLSFVAYRNLCPFAKPSAHSLVSHLFKSSSVRWPRYLSLFLSLNMPHECQILRTFLPHYVKFQLFLSDSEYTSFLFPLSLRHLFSIRALSMDFLQLKVCPLFSLSFNTLARKFCHFFVSAINLFILPKLHCFCPISSLCAPFMRIQIISLI